MHASAGTGIAAYVQTSSFSSQAATGPEYSYLSAAPVEATEQLLLWCKARLNAHALPISIAVLPQLPVSAGGKLARRSLPPPSWAAEGIRLPFEGNGSLPEGEALRNKQAPEGKGMSVKGNSLLTRSEGLPIEPKTVGDDISSQKSPIQTSMAAQKEESLNRFIPVSEGRVLGLFREALGLFCLEPTENFLQAGGDSLAAAAVANSLVIPPDMLTAFPTARALAAAIRHSSSASSCELHVTMAEAVGKSPQRSRAQLSTAAETQPLIEPPPLLGLNSDMEPAVATAAEEEEWQQQAQQEVLRCTQAGGWVFEQAGGLRWAGAGTPTTLLDSLSSLTKQSDTESSQDRNMGLQSLGHHAIEPPLWESPQLQQQQRCPPQRHEQQDKQHKSTLQMQTGQQQHQQQQQFSARPPHGGLCCAWRCKLKECIDASPVVLVTCSPEDIAQQQLCDSQIASWQLQSARSVPAQDQQHLLHSTQHCTQQQQQHQQHQEVFQHCPQDLHQHCQQQQKQEQQQQQHAQQQQQRRLQKQQWQQPGVTREWVLACSHGGDVVCVDGQSGRAVWRAVLPARAEAGLTVTSDCKVSVCQILLNKLKYMHDRFSVFTINRILLQQLHTACYCLNILVAQNSLMPCNSRSV